MEDSVMKKTIMVAGLAILLAAAPVMAQQMMGSGQQQQQAQPQQQYNPNQTYPGMMGGYGGYGGYGMGPGMMGGYGGYGGYGMGPGMMGTGQHPCMTGNYGYGMGPQMMGTYGYGMGPGMMGYYSPEQYEKQFKEQQSFLDETKELRKKLHTLKFDFAEAQRNPDTKPEDLEKMSAEMENIWKQIYEKKLPAAK
jgi:peptidoglycan hydrolase CwlO-like protein